MTLCEGLLRKAFARCLQPHVLNGMAGLKDAVDQKRRIVTGMIEKCRDSDRANAIVVGLRSAKSRFLENAAADRPEIWWLCSLRGTAPLRRSPGRGKMVCPSRISRAAVLGTSKQA